MFGVDFSENKQGYFHPKNKHNLPYKAEESKQNCAYLLDLFWLYSMKYRLFSLKKFKTVDFWNTKNKHGYWLC